MGHINQELEWYLRFFVDHRQKDWLEKLAITKFVVNNKTHTAAIVLIFVANNRRKLRKELNIKNKRKKRQWNS